MANRTRGIFLTFMVLAGLPSIATAAGGAATSSDKRWLRLTVEDENDGTRLTLRLPASIVEGLAPLLDRAENGPRGVSRRRLHIDGDDVGEEDLRRLGTAARRLRDGESARLEMDDGDQVTVSRRADRLTLTVVDDGRPDRRHGRDRDREREHIQIELPFAAFEALVAPPGDEIDPGAALLALIDGAGEVLRIDSDDSTVRLSVEVGSASVSQERRR